MITKKQKRSSRSYRERQALAKAHYARTPQIYKKDLHTDHVTILNTIVNFFMKFRRKQAR
jgi:hypothetical protein